MQCQSWGQKFSELQSVRSQSTYVCTRKITACRGVSIKLTQKMKKIDSLLH